MNKGQMAEIERLTQGLKLSVKAVRNDVLEIANEMALLISTKTDADEEVLTAWMEELRRVAGYIQ